MKKLNSQKGFTLIELLIVIAIIAVLAVALLPTLMGAPAKARDTQRTTQLQKIAGYLLTRSLAGNVLPAASACIDPNGLAGTIGELINTNVADFGGNFPKDPKAGLVSTGAAPVCNPADGSAPFYAYVKYDGVSAKKYSAAVYSAVEVQSNANVKCSDIAASKDPALAPGAIAAGTVGCYLVPIQ